MATTPKFETNYEDERFDKIEQDFQNDNTELDQTYGGMIDNTDQYYADLKDATQQWADKQSQIQQENTDFAIEQIEQQKDQAHKDYLKEQSGAYVDWRKQSNQYGTEAEKMASAGLDNTGFSESSQVSMYNTYQNRVVAARESFNKAVLNYNNAIKDAQLQNNAALAEIAYTALQQQLELSLEGFQYKNQLVLQLADKKQALKDNKWQKELAIIQQQNYEKEMAWDVEKYYDTQDWQTEQAELDRTFKSQEAELDRKFQAEQAEISRKFEAAQAELERKHDKEMLEAETKKQKEILAEQHKNDLAKLKKQQEYEMAQLNKKLENDKALLAYQKSLSRTSVSGGSSGGSSSGSKGSTKYSYPIGPTTATFTGSSYKDAVTYMRQKGVPSSNASAAMTENEWSRRRNSYSMTGKGATEVKNYSSYKAYIQDYVKYCVETYGK